MCSVARSFRRRRRFSKKDAEYKNLGEEGARKSHLPPTPRSTLTVSGAEQSLPLVRNSPNANDEQYRAVSRPEIDAHLTVTLLIS